VTEGRQRAAASRCGLGGRPWIPRPIEEQYWTARPWLALESVAEEFRYEEWIAGAVYVASARSPL